MKLPLVIVLFLLTPLLFAHPGDTTLVQTFTFKDTLNRRGIFHFPEDNRTWEKIIMLRTLKCDQATSADIYPCGEWAQSTSTFVYIPVNDTIERFELEGFVTPYGKRLQLGKGGWQVQTDVTDYAPLLKGAVDLSSGNQQELLDMKFLFIEGTPPREVLSIKNIYPFGEYQYQRLADDIDLKPVRLHLSPKGKGFKLKSRISGHEPFGQQHGCESEAKTHTYYGNGQVLFRWMVWKACSLNPLFPQGGTWQFDRAGWCPGAPVDIHEFELTNKVIPGDSLDFDYGIEMYRDNGEQEGYFRMSHQLVTYGPPSFLNDACVCDIIAPSTKSVYKRVNPVISSPAIVIQNTGKNLLQSLTITYGIKGRSQTTTTWNGRLPFLQQATVILPPISWQDVKEGALFEVSIASPNNTTDQYAPNNTLTSKVTVPPVLPASFNLYIRANGLNRAREIAYTLCNDKGTVLYQRNDFEDDVIYMDPIALDNGFYELRLTDTAQDGLIRHWWNRQENPARIGRDGRIAIMNLQGDLLHELSNDFGKELTFRFQVQE